MDAFHTDHHLQSRILEALHLHGVQSFSELKPDDVENSLFMYHMHKLISRGIVEKSIDGFRLTPSGARWVNQTDMFQRIAQQPRVLVELIVIQENQILISERVDHMAEHLNRYMLPGGLHRFGETSAESAERIAAKFGLELAGDKVGQAEIIIADKQFHGMVDFYPATAPNLDHTFDDDLFTVRFMPIEDVLSLSADDANALPQLVTLYLEGTLNSQVFSI